MLPEGFFSVKWVRKRDWVGIGLVFLMLVLYQCWQDRQQTYASVFIDAYYHLIFILGKEHPALFQQDWLMRDPSIVQRAFIAYPAYLSLLNLGIKAFGFFTTLSLFQFGLGMIYLAGAFLLLLHLTKRPWLSSFVAILSAFPATVFPGELRGVLSVALVMPGTVFLAFSPWLFSAWLQAQNAPAKLRICFLIQGIVGVLHPLSCLTFTFSMLFAQLVNNLRTGWRLQAFTQVIICGICCMLPLLPFIWQWVGVMQHQAQLPGMEKGAIALLLTGAFLPSRIQFLWAHWDQCLSALGWMLISIWVLVKCWRQTPPLVLYFILGSIVLWLSFYALNEWILLPNQTVFTDGYRTLKYLFLPFTIMIALWLKSYTGIPLLIRSSLLLFLTLVFNASLLWYDFQAHPTALARNLVRQWEAFILPFPPNLQTEQQDLLAMSQWIKTNLPLQNTLIHISVPNLAIPVKIRALGERSITWAQLDLANIDRRLLIQWWNTGVYFDHLRRQSGYCSPEEAQTARKLGATILICPATRSFVDFPRLYGNTSFSLYALKPLK